MCLGGVAGPTTAACHRRSGSQPWYYFDACNDWLARAFSGDRVTEPRRRALQRTALLQGAMLLAIALDDIAAFDEAVEGLPDTIG